MFNANLTSLHVTVEGKPSKRTLRQFGTDKAGQLILGIAIQDVVRPCIVTAKNTVKVHGNESLAKRIESCPALTLNQLGIAKPSTAKATSAKADKTKRHDASKPSQPISLQKVNDLRDLRKLGLKGAKLDEPKAQAKPVEPKADNAAMIQTLLGLLVEAIRNG